MKILFMGTPSYATQILKALLKEDFEILGLFTQADKPVGRKKVLSPPHIKSFVLEQGLNIPIFQPKNLKDKQSEDDIRALNPDVILVAAYGQILPKNILDIAPCINLHASLLPKFRGASPIQSSILADEAYTGVTAMMMEEGLDTGDMLGFSYIKIHQKTSEELFEELSQKAGELSVKVLKNFHHLKPLKQENALSNYAPKIKKEDGQVDIYSMDADEIMRCFRAFTPWPGIFFPDGVKILDIELLNLDAQNSVNIQSIEKDGVVIACKSGFLKLKKVQVPTKKPTDAYSYIQGIRKKVGDRLY